jgi:hypothetical protein
MFDVFGIAWTYQGIGFRNNRAVFLFQCDVALTGLYLRLQVEPTQFGSVDKDRD